MTTNEGKVLPKITEKKLMKIGYWSYALMFFITLSIFFSEKPIAFLLLVIPLYLDLKVLADFAVNGVIGSWQESHFDWRIQTVSKAIIFYALSLTLWFLFEQVWVIATLLIHGWVAYRLGIVFHMFIGKTPIPSHWR